LSSFEEKRNESTEDEALATKAVSQVDQRRRTKAALRGFRTLTDDQLIQYLKDNLARLGPEDLTTIVPDSELPMSWRTMAGLDWPGRDLLRNAARAKNGKLHRRTSLLVGQLVKRGLLTVVKQKYPNMTLEISPAGLSLLATLPDEEIDSPLHPDNLAADRRLMDCLNKARFGHE
jgi:hypothetical protein